MIENVAIRMHRRMQLNNGVLGIIASLVGPTAIIGGILLIWNSYKSPEMQLYYNLSFILFFSIFFFIIGISFTIVGGHLINKPFHKIFLEKDKIILKRTLFRRIVPLKDINKVSMIISEINYMEVDVCINQARSLQIIVIALGKMYKLRILYVPLFLVEEAIDFFNENLADDPFHDTIGQLTSRKNPSLQKTTQRYVWTMNR